MRECDEAKGRGGHTPDKADPGLAGEIAASGDPKLHRHEGRAGHTTPSGRSEASIVSVTKILAPTNRFAMQRGDLIHAWLRQISWIEDGLPDADDLVKSTAEKSAGIERAEVASWARRVLNESKMDGTELHLAFAKPAAAPGETIELWRERAFAAAASIALCCGATQMGGRFALRSSTSRPTAFPRRRSARPSKRATRRSSKPIGPRSCCCARS
jgi:hypothetical protein